MCFRFPFAAGCIGLTLFSLTPPVIAEETPKPQETPAAAEPAPSPAPAEASPAPIKAATARPQAAGSSLRLLKQLDEGFSALFEGVAPSVVIIEAERNSTIDSAQAEGFDFLFRHRPGGPSVPFPLPQQPDQSEGSGFIFREDGYILTNNHVIEDAETIHVRLKDGRQFDAKVIGRDEKTDIAVIKIDAKDLPVAPLGNSDEVKVGQLVFSIGIPYNLDYSFSGGWVSAKGRNNLLGTTDPRVLYEDYIQTDAFINPGNSGGPLFDIEGRVIGMNSFINGIGRGLAFAIPSNMLRTVGDQLVSSGKVTRPWLGIRMLGDEQVAQAQFLRNVESGVVVQTILPDTPAFKSDLRPADVITHVDGVAVRNTSDMQKEVLKKKVGETLKLTVIRNGEKLEIPVATGELPENPAELARRSQPDRSGAPGEEEQQEESAGEEQVETLYGLQIQDLTEDLAEQLNLEASGGALVTDVEPNSPAALADIRRQDVITEVDAHGVSDARQAEKLIRERDANKGILLFIDRRGQKTYAVLKAKS